MTKFLAGCLTLIIGVTAFADNSIGIAYGKGEVRTNRSTTVWLDFWVASTEAGIYGHFSYEDKQRGGPSDNVRVWINRFLEFQCEDSAALFFGEGYVNGTPRIIGVYVRDAYWFPDEFGVASFHPISGTLLYDRYGWFNRGGVSVLCELPNGPDN
ncbi:MAG: hypothetical protein HRF45_13870 [Fimbriimonadia bacterium]|jgi:hypothetical protein